MPFGATFRKFHLIKRPDITCWLIHAPFERFDWENQWQ